MDNHFAELLKAYSIKYNVHLSTFTTFLGVASGEQIVLGIGIGTAILGGIGTLLGIRKGFYDSESAKFDYIFKKRKFNLNDFQVVDNE